MLSKAKSKLTHDKFRFHVSTLELHGNRVQVGGNNYRVSLKLTYKEEADYEQVNLVLTESCLKVCEELHHKTIVPAKCSFFTVNLTERQVNVDNSEEGVHFSFPQASVKVCSLSNTHIEDLCGYIGEVILGDVKEKIINEVSVIKVKISQNIGPRAVTQKIYLDNIFS